MSQGVKHTKEDLKIMQNWSLERKIRVTQLRIMEWYQLHAGQVCISFSGGKDSTVLLDLARRVYPDIPAAFVDTGLEYPEIRDFVKTKGNVEWLRPAINGEHITFKDVLIRYGYPVVSKEVAGAVNAAKRGAPWGKFALEGKNIDGTESMFKKRFCKYKSIADAPFGVGSGCCYALKEGPLNRYVTRTRNKHIIGTMATDSRRRMAGWIKTGCNTPSTGKSKPMAFWTTQDVLQYLKITGIPYASVYGEIVGEEKLLTTGEQRTGCMFCMFGVHLEKPPNRFQRMKITHPKLYQYGIGGGGFDEGGQWVPTAAGLGIGFVLDWLGVPYV